jgi:uncharacterized protein with HEPN domain
MKENKVYLLHIIDAINSIENFVKNINEKEFYKNDLVQSAVIKKIEIIGEAAKLIGKEIKNDYKNIPWKQIAGMRDKLTHDYFGVDLKRVWEVTQKDIPHLKTEIENILNNYKNRTRQLEL